MHVAAWAKRFLFRSEQLDTPVARLSGGEQARILIARLMLQPADLLILDEPTNDLDIPTLEVLEESLLEFPGALVLVTHDRYLLDSVSTSILALDGQGGAELRGLRAVGGRAPRVARRPARRGRAAAPGRAAAAARSASPTARSASGSRWRRRSSRPRMRWRGAARGRRSRRSPPTPPRSTRATRSWRPPGRGRAPLRALGGAGGEAGLRTSEGSRKTPPMPPSEAAAKPRLEAERHGRGAEVQGVSRSRGVVR